MHRTLLTVSILAPGLALAQNESQQRLDLQVVATIIVEQTNALRLEHDREPLELDMTLEDTGRYYADYMAGTDTYGHTADGNQPAERATQHGYEYCIVSENVAYARRSDGFDEHGLAEQLVQGWIDSPEHRRNMLDAALTEIGVAVARSEQSERYYAVQIFGRPQADTIEFSIANRSGGNVRYRLADRDFTLPPGATRMHGECRAPEIEVSLPRGAEQRARTIQPNDQEQWVVEEGPDGWRVEQQ